MQPMGEGGIVTAESVNTNSRNIGLYSLLVLIGIALKVYFAGLGAHDVGTFFVILGVAIASISFIVCLAFYLCSGLMLLKRETKKKRLQSQ